MLSFSLGGHNAILHAVICSVCNLLLAFRWYSILEFVMTGVSLYTVICNVCNIL